MVATRSTLKGSGDCLEPVFKDGDKMEVDKEGALLAGDYVVFYHRPQIVPPSVLPNR